MMISKINPAMTKIGFGTAQKDVKKEELPTFIYDTDKLPEGYHWEMDDYDKYIAVKNGYKYNEDKLMAEPVVPYTPVLPNIVVAKKADPNLMYEPKIGEQPKAGYHWEHYLDGDRFYAVKDGYHLDDNGNAVQN